MRSISFMIRSILVAATIAPQLAFTQQAAALRIGEMTRISSSGRSTQGRVAFVTRDSVTLVTDTDRAVTVSILASDTVWTRHALTAKGALVGAGYGAALLGALAGAAATGLCEADCSHAFRDGFLVGGVVGAGGGGLLGAVAGSFLHRWKRIRP
jgi:hypothetical protein